MSKYLTIFFPDDQLNILPEVDTLKKSHLLIIADELLINMNTTKAYMWIINRTESFQEVAMIIKNDTISIQQYKSIFFMIG